MSPTTFVARVYYTVVVVTLITSPDAAPCATSPQLIPSSRRTSQAYREYRETQFTTIRNSYIYCISYIHTHIYKTIIAILHTFNLSFDANVLDDS